jgi:nucleoside permease NupC
MSVYAQCRGVAILVGLKTIVNEFTAYDRLGEFARAGILSKRKLTL